MTHIPGTPVKFDPPDEWKKTDRQCNGCGQRGHVQYRTHESSCGGYEDDEFKCSACKYTWWIDGPDA